MIPDHTNASISEIILITVTHPTHTHLKHRKNQSRSLNVMMHNQASSQNNNPPNATCVNFKEGQLDQDE